MTPLSQLHDEIDARVNSVRLNQLDWPCGKGCDSCCRHLADVPLLTETEWALLQEGLAALAPERLLEINQNITALAGAHPRPVVCPLLDRTSGACPVYPYRPVACRTYGFYVERDKGLYCSEIESRVTAGTLADVVWGNHQVVDNVLQGFGETRELTEWFKLKKRDT